MDRTLLLVDGFSVLYRAYHAIPGLKTKAGRPTNALFGFVRMLRQIIAETRPTHMAVVFDGGLPARRMTLLPEYKAQRPPMPDELRSQIPLVNEYLSKAMIERICVEGEEADDVLATLGMTGKKAGFRVRIATSDKDLFQMVDEQTMLVPVSAGGRFYDRAAVVEKTGVCPGLIPDWLALVGDSADNIGGVFGVGPKTAATLLNRYGSLLQLLESPERIEDEKLRAKIETGREVAARNLELMRLKLDVPCDVDIDQLKTRPPDAAALTVFLDAMELHTLASIFRQTEMF